MDDNTIQHVAKLARLKLTEQESLDIGADLNRILEHAGQLSELDTSNVEPLAHPGDIVNALRSDEARESFERSEILANAPKSNEEFYLVPAVLGSKKSS